MKILHQRKSGEENVLAIVLSKTRDPSKCDQYNAFTSENSESSPRVQGGDESERFQRIEINLAYTD